MKRIILPIISLILIGVLAYFAYDKMKDVDIKIKLKEVEIYSKHIISDFIEVSDGELLNGNEEIEFNELKKVKIVAKIKNRFNTKMAEEIEVNVVDKTPPEIECKEKIEITEGDKIDLLKYAKATDNYDKEVTISVLGEYATNKVGVYKLKFQATDSSNNKKEKDFLLNVKEKKKEVNIVEKKQEDKTFTTSKGFNGVTKNGLTYIDGTLVVNKTYSLPSSYNPGLTNEFVKNFNEMKKAAASDGIKIWIDNSFRRYSDQKIIYNNYVKRDGQAAADTYSARPGHSEHQAGLAADLNTSSSKAHFENTKEYAWLKDNCYKYGFILRYLEGKESITGYKFEPWHYRYVGVDLATKLYNNGNWIALEEYFGITSKYE